MSGLTEIYKKYYVKAVLSQRIVPHPVLYKRMMNRWYGRVINCLCCFYVASRSVPIRWSAKRKHRSSRMFSWYVNYCMVLMKVIRCSISGLPVFSLTIIMLFNTTWSFNLKYEYTLLTVELSSIYKSSTTLFSFNVQGSLLYLKLHCNVLWFLTQKAVVLFCGHCIYLWLICKQKRPCIDWGHFKHLTPLHLILILLPCLSVLLPWTS